MKLWWTNINKIDPFGYEKQNKRIIVGVFVVWDTGWLSYAAGLSSRGRLPTVE
jgi:hypothetical protein